MSAPSEGAPTPMDEFTFAPCDDGHGGPGWYYWVTEYPDDGSEGPFENIDAARLHCFESVCDADDKRIADMSDEELKAEVSDEAVAAMSKVVSALAGLLPDLDSGEPTP